jgi:predicted ester cyclase
MSAEQNKAILRQAYDAINRNDLDALDEMVASDITDHDPAPGQGPGLEGVKDYFSSLHAAFPGFRMDVEDMIAEGDKVVARVTGSGGTHQGEFMGIAPTGNRVTFRGIDILRVTDGKVVEHWGRFDDLGFLQQLGAVEQPAG